MITLITGSPGAGKTLYTVSQLIPEHLPQPIFVDGIPDLKLPHIPFPKAETDHALNEWESWAPPKGVLVVDEVQRIWRPRPNGSKVPAAIQALETHRHKGVDFILITQHPQLLDQNVRKLVGRHIHVRRVFGWGRAVVYEWDAATDPTRVRSAVSTTSWSYSKKSFDVYKSAEVHTKQTRKIPFALKIIPVALVMIGVLIWSLLFRDESAPQMEAETASGAPLPASAAVPVHELSTNWDVDLFTPRDQNYPESAPAYSHLVNVTNVPYISACISTATRCKCYTAQGAPLTIPEPKCRSWTKEVQHDPYHVPGGDSDGSDTVESNQTPPSGVNI